jgi:drug/metabolite transporter (DMT)-like permease
MGNELEYPTRSHRHSLILPVLSCLLAALLFGAWTPISKFLLASLGPFTLAGLFYLGGALAVLPASRKGGSAELRRDPVQIRRLLGAVIFGGGIGPVLLLIGLRAAPAASVSLWLNFETIATALLAWVFFREHLDRRVVAAVAMVFVAGILLAAPGGFNLAWAGVLVGLACVAWGIDNNLTALISGYTPAQTTLVKGVVAGSVNLSIGIILERQMPTVGVLLIALGVGGLAVGVSIALYIFGAQHLGATRSQLIFATAPFLGVILSWAFLGEPVLAVQIASGALMAVGIGILLTSHHEHSHVHEAVTHTHSHTHDDGHHDHVHPGVPASVRHTHPHTHEETEHEHPHVPDLHHRHEH